MHSDNSGAAVSRAARSFMEFLRRIMNGDEAIIGYLARVAGYALTGDTSEQCLFFLYGQGSNGKSVFVGALCEALGDYAHTSEAETFLSSKNDRHPTELARLADARLVIANEADADRQWNEARLKKLTGGDRMSARFMRQDEFEFTPQLELMIVGNHKPSFRGVNYAIRRRLQLIPFNVTIPPEDVDKSLPETLREELGGILQWMINGCLDWQRRKELLPPRDVTEATEHYLNQEDTFGQWVNAAVTVSQARSLQRPNCGGAGPLLRNPLGNLRWERRPSRKRWRRGDSPQRGRMRLADMRG